MPKHQSIFSNNPISSGNRGGTRINPFIRKCLVVGILLTGFEGRSEETTQNDVKTQTTHLSTADRQEFQEVYAQMPAGIRAFEKMDFDARRVQEEYLCLKTQETLFMDAVRYHLLPENPSPIDPNVSMAMEMADLGCSSMVINPRAPIRETAQKCGMKRVCAFLDFKKGKKKAYFLDGKDDFYRGGLSAEIRALDGVSRLFPLEDWLKVKKEFMAEMWHYDRLHSHAESSHKDAYHQVIYERALQKQRLEQKVFMAHGRN